MCPIDPSPHGGEILHQPPKAFPPERLGHDHTKPDILHRPALPDHCLLYTSDAADE